MSTINFSFIIPHKDVPELLIRCINTIPDRKDTEIIVVDDCSVKCPIDQFALPSRKVATKVIFLEQSKGAGYARNEGIRIARGKWLLFADADDYYTNKLSAILTKYENDINTDLVYLNAQYFYESSKVTAPTAYDRYFTRYIKKKWYSEKVLRYYMWTPWTRMVKRALVEKHDIKYEQIPTGNDKMFSIICSRYAKNISAESSMVYNYCMADNKSVTYSYSIRPETLRTKLDLLLRTNEFYKEVGFIFKSSILYFYLSDYRSNQDPIRKEIFKEYFHRRNYNLFCDTIYMCFYIFGKFIKVL